MTLSSNFKVLEAYAQFPKIVSIPKFICLSRGLQHVTTLETLAIGNCSGLVAKGNR